MAGSARLGGGEREKSRRDAVKHLENAISGEEKVQLEQLLADLKTGKAHDVEHELERMLEPES